ncbi:hypothetical protein Glove_132g88 [Diversispora epigaea]|uniref:HAT C-terminal dimerisation domain-containing protein n=1 Tax=Diversispora epigaea TaxID=1348612 RepID=A0A397J1F1_9GLOM|nr:hypothetical protein Glove_132g88 [Diversispora epigaea]
MFVSILAIKFEPPITEIRRRAGEDPTLKREIYEIISSSIFWQHLGLLVEILHPYCKILNMLQSNKARLHEVIHSLAYIAQFWNNYSDSNLATRLIIRLEKRWKEWEQPLLLLAYLLHPDYRIKLFNNSNINYATLGSWLGYYYNVWMEKQPKCILKELDNYRLEVYPFNSSTWNQFNSDIYRYWCFCCASTNELGFVACRIFGICVNTASVERLWSCMGFLQSNRRNRLSNSKVLEMSKLRADITYNHRRQTNVPLTTIQTILSEIESLKYNEEYLADNENPADDENLQVIQNSQDPVEFDISMLEDESKGFDEIDDEEAENITHPAINFNAKLSNSKVLEMSKLRADITYNHRRQTNVPLTTIQTILSEIESLKYNEEYLADNENPADDENLQVIQNSQDPVEFDVEMEEDINLDDIEDDFGNYLQE